MLGRFQPFVPLEDDLGGQTSGIPPASNRPAAVLGQTQLSYVTAMSHDRMIQVPLTVVCDAPYQQ